jgi:ABC transporter substrate binding protein
MIGRRQFITLLGGAAAWPLAARAQQERMRRIGVLVNFAADDPLGQARHGAFLQGLQQAGWTIGRNVQVETRWGPGDADRLRTYAAELAALAPDVILATGNAGVAPMLQATRSVPIVFVIVPDPVGAGFVDSLAHRLHLLRIRPEREMAGAAERDRACRDESGSHSRPRARLRAGPVRRHPVHGAVARGGGEPDQHARYLGDRARRRRLRARGE